jgi:hypothetical protein
MRENQDQASVDSVRGLSGNRCTTNFIAGLRSTSLFVPLVLDGPMIREASLAHPRAVPRGDPVKGRRGGLDNLSTHEVVGVSEAIGARASALSTGTGVSNHRFYWIGAAGIAGEWNTGPPGIVAHPRAWRIFSRGLMAVHAPVWGYT